MQHERGMASLTVKLLIFEVNRRRRTLTADVADALASVLSAELAWQTTSHLVKSSSGSPDFHYELRLTHRTAVMTHKLVNHAEVGKELEQLCHDICHPDGRAPLRRVNPNPNLVFTVGVDCNSPTDDMFLRSFVKHTARHSTVCPIQGREAHGGTLSIWQGHFEAIFTEWLQVIPSLHTLIQSGGGQPAGGEEIWSAAGTAVRQYLANGKKDDGAGDAKRRPLSNSQVSTTLAQAISSLEIICTHTAMPDSIASSELRATAQHLSKLKEAMLALAEQKNSVEHENHIVSTATRVQLCITVASCVTVASLALLRPEIGSAIADNMPAWLPWLQDMRKLALLVPGIPGLASWSSGQRSRETADMSQRLRDTDRVISHKMYLTVLDALRGDFRDSPDAAGFAKLIMDMAAAINPTALESWDEVSTTREGLDWELNRLVLDWAKSAEQSL